jgi:hypothetical protein
MATELAVSAIEVLDATPRVLRALMESMPDEVVTAPGEEGWSARDVVAHLASVQGPALFERVRLMLESDEPPIPNVDEEAVLASSGLRDRPVREVMEQFSRERAEAVAWIRELPSQSFGRGGRHEVAGRITVADQLNHFAYHDLAHIRQVTSLLIPRLERARGAMGEAFPDSA